jgi:hypothetical protein
VAVAVSAQGWLGQLIWLLKRAGRYICGAGGSAAGQAGGHTLMIAFLAASAELHSRVHQEGTPSRPARPACGSRRHASRANDVNDSCGISLRGTSDIAAAVLRCSQLLAGVVA